MNPAHPSIVTLLPTSAARQLQQAALIPVTRADPLARVKAVDKAVERVRRDYPQFFKQDNPCEESLR